MNLAASVDALERQHDVAMRLLRSYGWYPFGSHVDNPDVKLTFYGLGEDGLPVLERVVVR